MLMRLDAAALVPVVQDRQSLFVHVERAADIVQTLSLKQEFPQLKLVLVGVSEGWLVADRLAAAKVPVIASALNDLHAKFPVLAATPSNTGRTATADLTQPVAMTNDQVRRTHPGA